jgi:hypothetical protein
MHSDDEQYGTKRPSAKLLFIPLSTKWSCLWFSRRSLPSLMNRRPPASLIVVIFKYKYSSPVRKMALNQRSRNSSGQLIEFLTLRCIFWFIKLHPILLMRYKGRLLWLVANDSGDHPRWCPCNNYACPKLLLKKSTLLPFQTSLWATVDVVSMRECCGLAATHVINKLNTVEVARWSCPLKKPILILAPLSPSSKFWRRY